MPADGQDAHITGDVVLQATTSQSGAIENLHAVSGPPLLIQAAMDAVMQWKYKPYLLNNEPVICTGNPERYVHDAEEKTLEEFNECTDRNFST